MAQRKPKPKGKSKPKPKSKPKGTPMTSTTPPPPNPLPQPTPPPVSIFEQWAKRISRILTEESGLVGEFVDHPTLIGNAREALIHGVLDRVLPSIYEIGTGQIIDAAGNKSKQMDVVIARKDFPALRFPDGSAQYLVESVLATIEVKSELNSETLPEALDNCYSLGALSPSVEPETLKKFVENMNQNSTATGVEYRLLQSGVLQERRPGQTWAEPISPIMQMVKIRTKPESYIFGFEGYSKNATAMRLCIEGWLKEKQSTKQYMSLAHLPAVIAAKGCVVLRNQLMEGIDYKTRTWPLMVAAVEPNPLGRFIVNLLRAIQRAVLPPTSAEGLRPTLALYLNKPTPVTGERIGVASF
jgi:hypothetical protein